MNNGIGSPTGMGAADPPEESNETYLPENYYFVDASPSLLDLGSRATALCVAQWADRFWASSLLFKSEEREGALPSSAGEREAVLRQVLEWLGRVTDNQLQLARLILYQDETWLLDAHDGFPGVLHLSRSQFGDLQRCWDRYRLPTDLYFPAQQERTVVEPVQKYGGVVRIVRKYSPLQWMHRKPAAVAALVVPTEEERRDRFLRELEGFSQALLLRANELLEPGRERNLKEISKLFALQREVAKLISRERRREDTEGSL